MPMICPICPNAQFIPKICQIYFSNMPNIFLKYAQDRPMIYPRYARDEPAKGVPKICPIYSQNMLKIWIWLNMPIFGSQRSEQPKYVQFGQKIKILDLNQVSYPFNKYRIQFYKKNVWKQCHWRGGGLTPHVKCLKFVPLFLLPP